jgi:hypothetical protein
VAQTDTPRQASEPYTIIRIAVNQLRFYSLRDDEGEAAELDRLGDSLRKRQDSPLLIGQEPENEVYDGNRRLRAALRKGIEFLDAVRLPFKPTADQVQEIFLRTAVHRKGLSDFEKFRAVKQIALAHPDWNRKQLAEHLDLEPPEVTKLLSEGCPEVEEAFSQGRIGLSVRYELIRFPIAEQPALLAAKLAGVTTRDGLAAKARRGRIESESAARVQRAKIPVGDGITVTVAGQGSLTIEQILDALSDAAKEVRRARDQGLSIKTLSAVARERARAGGGT